MIHPKPKIAAVKKCEISMMRPKNEPPRRYFPLKSCPKTDVNSQPESVLIDGPKRRALLIGINYFGTNNELRGCLDDVYSMHALLSSLKYDEISLLVDD